MTHPTTPLDALVIGAGQAGLATGYNLARRGLKFAILERGAQPCGSWPHYYESLRLFSPARYSALPGLPFPGDPDAYPGRDEVSAYLQSYAAHHDLPVRTGQDVASVHRDSASERGSVFTLTTTSGTTFQSRALVAATGCFDRPNLPQLPGQADFQGRILHSADYRRPDELRGQRVLVVGGGNSAVQIAYELAPHTELTLVTRSPIDFLRQTWLGRDIHFWLSATGIDRLPLKQSAPVLDDGLYKNALASGQLHHVDAMFTAFTDAGVRWPDGRCEDVDTVIFATGFHQALPTYLEALYTESGPSTPYQRRGISTDIEGLYVVGLPGLRTISSETLRGVGRDAAKIVDHLVGHVGLRQSGRSKTER